MPTPGSPAAKALAERRAAKGLPALPLLGSKKADAQAAEAVVAPVEAKSQRVQPQRKNRKRK
jgi:YidC/Oxa1 family membrane protein insertase